MRVPWTRFTPFSLSLLLLLAQLASSSVEDGEFPFLFPFSFSFGFALGLEKEIESIIQDWGLMDLVSTNLFNFELNVHYLIY